MLIAVVLVGSLSFWLMLRGSLPHLGGELALPGVAAPVTITRDARGVVTIEAASEADAVRALGFVHAQERYFEMDLARRSSAGELAALLGPPLLPTDRERRPHRMRARVAAYIGDGDILGSKRPALDAYAAGVNAGLDALSVRPWPYLLLRQTPVGWTAEDTVLAAHALYFNLQGRQPFRRLAIWRLSKVLPAPLFAMLTHGGSQWDAPLVGAPSGDAPLPGPDAIDLRRLPGGGKPVDAIGKEGSPGSNNLAVAGPLTADGRAIVGGDMHLSLGAPGYWFRARLIYPDARAPSGKIDVSGFTLPGIPAVIAGSNGHVAWSLTNSYVDSSQWALAPSCSGTASNCGITEHRETIAVAGGTSETLVVRETEWGPVLATEPDGGMLALRWAAHLPGAIGSGLADFAVARDLDDLFAIADRAGGPAQNLVAGDRTGRIGWRLLGALPDWTAECIRTGVDRIVVPAGSCPPWKISTAISPRVRDPASNRLWTANNRVLGGEENTRLGYIGLDSSARAHQIRDSLLARESFSERDILGIQLDDRALFLEPWWKLLREVVGAGDGDPLLAKLEAASRLWDGHASTGSVSYLLTRRFHRAIEQRVIAGLLTPFPAAAPGRTGALRLGQTEGFLWPMVTARPAHLLPSSYPSWQALLRAAARDVARDPANIANEGRFRTWGEVNTAEICHPLARALPVRIKHLVCMPADPLPGDHDMPRVQTPAFGASQRMAVSPGREQDGFIQMPGGQSDHPLSPFWGVGHEDWVKGTPAPFLPGTPEHVLKLVPASSAAR